MRKRITEAAVVCLMAAMLCGYSETCAGKEAGNITADGAAGNTEAGDIAADGVQAGSTEAEGIMPDSAVSDGGMRDSQKKLSVPRFGGVMVYLDTFSAGETESAKGIAEGQEPGVPATAQNGEYVQIPEEAVPLYAVADVDSYANIRNIPGTEGEVVGRLYHGGVAQILETSGNDGEWYHIVSGDVEGYIKKELLLNQDESAIENWTYAKSIEEERAEREEQLALAKQEEQEVKAAQENNTNQEETESGAETGQGVLPEETADNPGTAPQENGTELQNPEGQTDSQTQAANEELRGRIVEYAMQFLGNPYVHGGNSLTEGTDCSGFTSLIYAEFGYSLSRTPGGQLSGSGRSVEYSAMQPGDVICYGSGSKCTHVALYIGDGQIIHEANKRQGVIIGQADYDKVLGVKNIID